MEKENWDSIKKALSGAWDKVKDESLGTWKEFKKDLLAKAEAELSSNEKNKIKATVRRYEKEQGYKNDSIITIEKYLIVVDELQEIINNELPETADKKDFLAVASSQLYHNFRSTIATGSFEEGERWPEADLSNKALAGKAYIMPDRDKPIMGDIELAELQAAMREKVMNLQKYGDLAADVFDILTAKWLKEARHYEAMVNITADDFLTARGLKGKRGKVGSGYREKQRKEIRDQIDVLSYTWITVEEMEVIQETDSGKRKKSKWRGESKAVVLSSRFGQVRVDGSTDSYAWRLRPGDVFAKFLHGPGRQTALLSQKALQYHHYRQKWEKRLARYLAWIWRISGGGRTKEGVLVKTLLDAAGTGVYKRMPSKTRDRLEEALDQLQTDGVITAWEYETTDESITDKRGWWKEWLEWKVLITAPEEILEHYKQIKKKN